MARFSESFVRRARAYYGGLTCSAMERKFASLHASLAKCDHKDGEQSICINTFPVSPYSEEICRTVQSVFCSFLQSNGIDWQAEAQQLSCFSLPDLAIFNTSRANSTSNCWTYFSPGLICCRSGRAGGSSTIGTSFSARPTSRIYNYIET